MSDRKFLYKQECDYKPQYRLIFFCYKKFDMASTTAAISMSTKKTLFFYLLAMTATGLTHNTLADDLGINVDNIFQNIDQVTDSSAEDNAISPAPSAKTLLGGERRFTYKHDFSYVTSTPSQVETNRSSLRLQWNKGFNEDYYIHIDVKALGYFSNDRNAREEDKSFVSDTNTKEFYIQGSWSNTSITAGNKIVIWGESETAPVTDVISPQNQSELVFTSLDESRISQTMIIIDQYMENGHWTFIVNPDVKTDEDPPGGEAKTSVHIIDKKFESNHPEYALRWKRAVGIGDFSIMLADLSDNQSVYIFKSSDNAQVNFDRFYGRYQMLGAAANINYGDIAIQVESAFSKDRPQQLSTHNPNMFSFENTGYVYADMLQTGFTLKYQENGLRDWTLGLLNSHVFDDVSKFENPEKNINDLMAAVANKFLHETLTLSFTHMYKYETHETIQNLTAEYLVSDNFKLTLDLFKLEDVGPEDFNQDSIMLRGIYTF